MGEKGLHKNALRGLAWKHLHYDAEGKTTGWDTSDGEHAFNPNTGQNAVWDKERGQWIDTKTGQGLTPQVFE